jgi:hypothetical protein
VVTQPNLVDAATDFVVSVYVKKNAAQRTVFGVLRVNFGIGAPGIYGVAFDDFTGDIRARDSSTAANVGIEDAGDSWRVWLRVNSLTSNVLEVDLWPAWANLPLSNGLDFSATGAIEANKMQIQKGVVLGPYVRTLDVPSAPGMRARSYVVDRIDGPSNGKGVIVAKDLLSRIEERKSVAPKASRGELFADITSGATSFQLFPAGVGAEYLAAGSRCALKTRSSRTRRLPAMSLAAARAARSARWRPRIRTRISCSRCLSTPRSARTTSSRIFCSTMPACRPRRS